MASLARFREPWEDVLRRRSREQHGDFPDYHVADPGCLVSTSQPVSFQLGTGASIYTNALLPAILDANHEICLVTCFWAKSSTLTALSDTLAELARRRQQQIVSQQVSGPDADELAPLRVRIGLSSLSLFQKLFHTSSKDGVIYHPSVWSTKLGLPSQDELVAARIDLQVKSLFFTPFSVMHPKFLIVDRQSAWLPSCNISWEPWLEGCVQMQGHAVSSLVKFYQSVWEADLPPLSAPPRALQPVSLGRIGLTSIQSPATLFRSLDVPLTPTVLLPSSHHRTPRFRLPWQSQAAPPATPLNCAIERLFEMAEKSIYIQTPNITAAAAINGVLSALERGIDVVIVTSKNMMLLEQLVTAGTTTSLCLRSLIKRYKKLRQQLHSSGALQPKAGGGFSGQVWEELPDLEAQRPRLGSLRISYYQPIKDNIAKSIPEEPVQSHLKLTIVDGQYTVLGSGNMDRASWFTSQELGIMFQSAELANTTADIVGEVLRERLSTVFDSEI